jgi:uncharacterized RDD family membrane protein YckC
VPVRAHRIGARAVDLVLVAWVVGILVVEVSGRFLGGDPLATRAAQPVTTTEVLVAFVGAVVLLDVLPTALWGRTAGKALFGLRVVPIHGSEPVPGASVGFVSATLRSSALYLPVLVPYAGGLLAAGVVLSTFLLPGGRGLPDLLAGTAVVGRAPEARARHRYPRRAIDPLPLPEVAKLTLVELGLPGEVPGLFRIDRRLTVYDEILFSVGTDPTGMALCVLAPSGEVVAVDPDADRPHRMAAPTLPAFVEALDAVAEAGAGEAADALRAFDPELLEVPDSWWVDVL